ncbi:50S ribosomal protein L24 [bacterium]|nr:50S ribosomal protein L24 [bacterium]
MKIKVSDKVQIISGKDKGKTGKVVQVLPEISKAVVDGINVMYKHLRPQKKGEKGQRVQFNGPVRVSNMILICPKCSKPSRTGIKLGEDRKGKARFCKKCKEVID